MRAGRPGRPGSRATVRACSSADASSSPAIPVSSAAAGASAATPTRAAPVDAAVTFSPAPRVNTWVRTPSGAYRARIRSVAVSSGPSHTPASANSAAVTATDGANAAAARAAPVPASAHRTSRPDSTDVMRPSVSEPPRAPTANAVISTPPPPGLPSSVASSTETVVSEPMPTKPRVVAEVTARSSRTRHRAASPAPSPARGVPGTGPAPWSSYGRVAASAAARAPDAARTAMAGPAEPSAATRPTAAGAVTAAAL